MPLKSSQISQEIFKIEAETQVFCNEVGKIFKNTFCLASYGPDLEIRKKLNRNWKKKKKQHLHAVFGEVKKISSFFGPCDAKQKIT